MLVYDFSVKFSFFFFTARPSYRKKNGSEPEYSVGGLGGRFSSTSGEAPAMLVPSLMHSVSVREAINEVKMVQVGSQFYIRFWCFQLSN